MTSMTRPEQLVLTYVKPDKKLCATHKKHLPNISGADVTSQTRKPKPTDYTKILP